MGIRIREEETVTLDVAGAEVSIQAKALTRLWIEKLTRENATVLGVHTINVLRPPAIGEYWQGQGGIYAGDIMGKQGGPQWSLVVPTDQLAQIGDMQYGGRGIDAGTDDAYDGLANTLKLFESKTDHPIAKWARGLTIDGHSDLYVPARREAMLCAINVPWLFRKEFWYWTSTQSAGGPGWAWLQDFDGGNQHGNGKGDKFWVCAVRRVSHSLIQ